MMSDRARKPLLTFEPDTHEYRLDGVRVPSVTRIISTIQAWHGIPTDVLEHARERGSKVDAAVNAYDASTLNVDALEDEIVPYVLAWQRFRRQSKCVLIDSQYRGANACYRYAGTLDKIIEINKSPFLVEIKATDAIEPEAALQTAAYSRFDAITEKYGNKLRRATLQLRSDADTRWHEWNDLSDFPTFLAALTLANWRQAH